MSVLKHRRTLTCICLAATACIAWLHFFEGRYYALEERARDWLATTPAARLSPPRPEIIFLGLDQASLDLDGLFDDDLAKSPTLRLMKQGFPWNRAVYAQIADRLVAAGARAVVFDIRFPGPRDGDEEFRAALDRHKDRIVIGSNLMDRDEAADIEQGTTSKRDLHELPTLTLLPDGAHDDRRIGFVNVRPGADGIVRSVYYRTSALQFFGKPPAAGAPELLSLVARALEKFGRTDLIPQTREPVSIRFTQGIFTRSLHEIFIEPLWAQPPYNNGDLFRDKIVLIGTAGNQAEDRLATPFGTVLAPTIHLSALNAAMNRDFLYPTKPIENLGLILVGGALAWLLGAIIRTPLVRLAALVAALALYYGAAQMMFNSIGLVLILIGPMLALAASGITWTAWEAVLEYRERQRTRQMVERYVSKDIVKEVLDNRESFLNVLGGERRTITVMFSDVRGFTTRTESADPHALVLQLNEYFEEMVRIVFANQGTLDKFIGDAVMAHWGSIVTAGAKTDAVRAVKTALEMRRSLVRLNDGWRARGIEPLAFGIGINHGEAIVGNLGCEAKMEVSVIGDAVNTASRLEGATKPYRLDLLIGELVEPFVREEFLVRTVDLLVVKGKTKPVAIFTVLGERTGEAAPAWLARHEEAMRLYRTGDFTGAETAWREVLAAFPGDGVCEVFIERCAELQKHPPEGDWQGVFEMKTK